MLLMLLVFLAVFVLFIFWVWMSIASAVVAVNKNRNPLLWCIAGLVAGPFAFMLLTKLSQGNTMFGNLSPSLDEGSNSERNCSTCGATNYIRNKYCNKCGASLALQRVAPPKLGQPIVDRNDEKDGHEQPKK